MRKVRLFVKYHEFSFKIKKLKFQFHLLDGYREQLYYHHVGGSRRNGPISVIIPNNESGGNKTPEEKGNSFINNFPYIDKI